MSRLLPAISSSADFYRERSRGIADWQPALDEIARRHLIAKRFADLRDAERQLAARRVENIFEINKNSLCSFWPQVSQGHRIIIRRSRSHGRAEHQVKITRIGQIGRTAV